MHTAMLLCTTWNFSPLIKGVKKDRWTFYFKKSWNHVTTLFIYWWQELALYMKCVIGSMFHWINGVSRGKMKFREEKWIWLIFPHETPFFLCETSFFRTKIHLSNEARNFDSLSLTETAFTKLKLYTVAQFSYQCLARPGSLTCWTSRVFIRYPVDSR